jgi:hypothetical protein
LAQVSAIAITDAIGGERRANEAQRGLPLEIGMDLDPGQSHVRDVP